MRPAGDHRRRHDRQEERPPSSSPSSSNGSVSSRNRPSTTCSSTPRGAPVSASPAKSRRSADVDRNRIHDSGRACAARNAAHTRLADPHLVHPALLPGGQHRPGGGSSHQTTRRSSKVRTTPPSSCRCRCCWRRRSAAPPCTSSRRSRAATSTSCGRRRSPRSAIVLGRLYSEFVKSLVITTAMVLIAWPFGIHIESGVIGYVLLVLMIAFWAVVFSGFMQLIALDAQRAATNAGSLIFFPLLFLTPNFVPRDMLARPMEIAATLNPVTYVMEAARSLILEDLEWATVAKGYLVVGCFMAVMLLLSVRTINNYDRHRPFRRRVVARRADGRRPVRRGGTGRPGDAACVDPRGGAGGVGAEVPGLVRGSRRRGARGAHRLGTLLLGVRRRPA